jgi:hypothetical protein
MTVCRTAALLLGILVAVSCGGTRRPWREPKSGPPKPWEEDVTVMLQSGQKTTFRVAWGRMEEVEPGIEHIVEYGKVHYRLSDLPCFGIEVAPLSGRHLLRCVYDHPPVIDAEGRRRTRKEQPGVRPVGPATVSVTHYNTVDLAHVERRWRVAGAWTLSVYEGDSLIKSVTFHVTSD